MHNGSGEEEGCLIMVECIAFPIEGHGFLLHNGDFRQVVCLRYGLQPTNLPSTSRSFTIEHALNRHTHTHRRLSYTLRHNEVRVFRVNVMIKAYHDVCI